MFRKKIKVFFIAQYKTGLNKFEDVVNAMKKDKKFEVKVIAFPEDIKEFPKNKDLEYWKLHFDDIVINAIEDDKWFDLKKEKPDYVFIQRPYDMYLPNEYSKDVLFKYTKVCYIPYGYGLAKIFDITMTLSDMKYIDIIISENDETNEYYSGLINQIGDEQRRVALNVGYPNLDRIQSIAKEYKNESAFKTLEKNRSLNVLWTPRWTTDKKACATSFFDYKEKIVNYCEKYKDTNLVFRPHPMTFDNFISKKLMTKAQVKNYLDKFNDNLLYDNSSEYLDTFKDTDVLITDLSSIIIEFLFFNKPIIYTQQDGYVKTKTLKQLSQCFYIAKDFNDIKNVLNNLKKGIDPLKDKREKILKRVSKKYDGKVVERILNYLKNDFKIKKKYEKKEKENSN